MVLLRSEIFLRSAPCLLDFLDLGLWISAFLSFLLNLYFYYDARMQTCFVFVVSLHAPLHYVALL